MRHVHQKISLIFAGLGILLGTGCGGDVTSGVGELGMLRYSIWSAYDISEWNISDARIITGHQQFIDVTMTEQGRREIGDPGAIQHRLDPADGVVIADEGSYESSDYVRGLRVTVTNGGAYTLESYDGEEVVDYIGLSFEPPAGFEVSMKVRDQWGEDFIERNGNPVVVDEGDQVIILAIPVDDSGGRLAGTMDPTIDVDPHWAVTPGHNIWSNTEDVTWEYEGAPDYYFIEPGTVTFTVSDPVSGASTVQAFDVQPVDHI